MNTFLSVAAGTDEPAKFLEIIYKGGQSAGGDATDVAFVGKGITFDSGGISLKPGADMKGESVSSSLGGDCILIIVADHLDPCALFFLSRFSYER